MSTEPAWDGIKPLPVAVYTPNSGAEPSEITEILVAHDEDLIYVAGRFVEQNVEEKDLQGTGRPDRRTSKLDAASHEDVVVPDNLHFRMVSSIPSGSK